MSIRNNIIIGGIVALLTHMVTTAIHTRLTFADTQDLTDMAKRFERAHSGKPHSCFERDKKG